MKVQGSSLLLLLLHGFVGRVVASVLSEDSNNLPDRTTAPQTACPTITTTATVCSTCRRPHCILLSTVSNPCGCPSAVPTVAVSFPCRKGGCAGIGCGTEYRLATRHCPAVAVATAAS